MEDRLETFEAHRRLLFGIAYRMLGSAADAEDMVQETYLRYQAHGAGEVASPRAFLVTVITRLCLDRLKAARTEREEYVGAWLPEPLLLEVGENPEERALERESLSLAFLVLLERLTPTERAVFLLREVFGYAYEEIAGIVMKSEANCRQLLRRAKQRLQERHLRFDSTPQERERLVTAFLAATQTGDVAQLVDALHEDVVLWADGGGKVPAAQRPVMGRENVARFLTGLAARFGVSVRPSLAQVNGQPAVLLWNGEALGSVAAPEVSAWQIVGLRIIVNPDKLRYLASQLRVPVVPFTVSVKQAGPASAH